MIKSIWGVELASKEGRGACHRQVRTQHPCPPVPQHQWENIVLHGLEEGSRGNSRRPGHSMSQHLLAWHLHGGAGGIEWEGNSVRIRK